MDTLRQIWELGQFFMLVVPSILVLVGMGLVGARTREGWERRRLLFLLVSAVVSLGLLDLLILTNPYGREISSSLTAFGVVPATVALLATLFNQSAELKRFWQEEKPLILALFAVTLGLLGVLWWLDANALYLVVIPTAVMGAALLMAQRLGRLWMTFLTLLIVAGALWLGGGWLWIPGYDAPAWQATLRGILTAAVILLTIILPAAMLYDSLKGDGEVDRRKLGWSIALSVLLLLGAVYTVYWDGIWSSAHARAYEDHLPGGQLLMSLTAGLLLALSLHGRRRWVGPAYTLAVMVTCVGALSAGWRVSAFELTARRAEQVDKAIQAFRQERGVYPAELSELTPRYRLFIQPPVVVRQGGWCYQDGGSGYRLGYISGDFTYFEADFKQEIFSEAGEAAGDEPWLCDELLEHLEAGRAIY